MTIALGWIGWKGYRLYRQVLTVWQLAQETGTLARELTANPTNTSALAALQPRLAMLETEWNALRQEVAPFLPLARRLAWLPRLGGVISAAPNLLDAGAELLTAGRLGLDYALPLIEVVAARGNHTSDAASSLDLLADALPSLEASAPAWQEIGAHLDRAQAALQGVDTARLPSTIGDRLLLLQSLIAQARPFLALLPRLPDLLGAHEERLYLIIAQNSDELRPTGGFISGVGLARLKDGRLVELSFQDSYAVDNLSQPHPPAPEPLRHIMGIELLFLRDANWSPDFPTSARVMEALYQQDQGREADGVIALDLAAVQLLVAALDPLQVPGIEEPVTENNVLAQIKAAWEQPTEGLTIEQDAGEWWLRRKDFMMILAQAIIQRLGTGDLDLLQVGRALWQAAAEKHLLIYLDDPVAQEAIVALGWDGGLHPGDRDFLAVFDSNVGYNKVNAVVTRQMDYTVAWETDSWAAYLVLTYTHPVRTDLDTCELRVEYGHTYDDLTQRCYWNYVRVYVPEGAQLLQAEGLDVSSLEVGLGEQSAQVIAGLFVMPPGTTHVVRLSYRLPSSVAEGDIYRLRIQKQPGTPAFPLRFTLIAPPNTTWTMGKGQANARLSLEDTLRQDTILEAHRVR
ncbi:MAG: DUF4012 domain-containing protein [Anaerolineae bacterium]|nr:DUF4012 domain-containing protein [Anaerolineae bacterium]MDW8099164.1 DUF4012 domain-containing protein [Anaerolineae bacterium]